MADNVTAARHHEIRLVLACIQNAEFEAGRGETDTALMWLGDARRSLGALALLCSPDPDAEGYARLLHDVLAPPTTAAEAAYIERQSGD